MFTPSNSKKEIKVLLPMIVILLGAFGIQKGMTHQKYNGTHPGYYKQWFEEKKNENGVIPTGLHGKWAAFDKASAMRRGSETPFDTLWELGPRSYGGRTRAVWIDPNSDNFQLETFNRQIKQEKKPKIFIQVNIGNEDQKSGINKDNLVDFYKFCKNLDLDIVGTMCIPPNDGNVEKYFYDMDKTNQELNFKELSMGMSGDYLEAIKNNATYIRVGSKIFGSRA